MNAHAKDDAEELLKRAMRDDSWPAGWWILPSAIIGLALEFVAVIWLAPYIVRVL